MSNKNLTKEQQQLFKPFGIFSTSSQAIKAAKKFKNNIVDDVKNSTVIVTGANSGVGKGIATALAKLGATVVLACRSLSKAEAAIDDIVKENKDIDRSKLVIIQLDLGSLKSIPKFVSEITAKIEKNELPKLRVLIENAGILSFNYNKTVDGIEQMFGVNHIGHFFLFQELVKQETIFADKKFRLVSVSSHSHMSPMKTVEMSNRDEIIEKVAHLTSKDMSSTFSTMPNYGTSKMCNVLFTRYATNKYYNGTYVTATSVNPGIVHTNVGQESFFVRLLMPIIGRLFFKNIDQGGATAVICSLLPDELIKEKLYFSNCKPCEPSDYVKSVKGLQAEETLWQLSTDLCQLFQQGKSLLEVNNKSKL